MSDVAREQAGRVVDLVRSVLEERVLGACLYGSAVMGGLRHGSDLDLLVVASDRTTRAEKARLVAGVAPISRRSLRPPGYRPVELTILVQRDVRPWRSPPRMDFQYGEWLQEQFDRGELEPADPENPDTAVLITTALRTGRPLWGAPPAELLDPVPAEDLDRAMRRCVPGLLADLETDTTNVLLTLARIWSTIATGDILSKDAAAAWAEGRLGQPDAYAMNRAGQVYLGVEPDEWHGREQAVAALGRKLVLEIRRARPESGSG